jgi:hypothetical protein
VQGAEKGSRKGGKSDCHTYRSDITNEGHTCDGCARFSISDVRTRDSRRRAASVPLLERTGLGD